MDKNDEIFYNSDKAGEIFTKPHYVHYELTPAKGAIVDFTMPSPSGRIYSKKAMEKAIKEYNEKPNPKFGEFVGEITHPDTYLNLTKVSHRVNDVHIDGDKVVADIDILDNDKGRVVKKLLELDQPLYLNPVFMIEENDSDVKLLYTTISQYPSINEKCRLEKYDKE